MREVTTSVHWGCAHVVAAAGYCWGVLLSGYLVSVQEHFGKGRLWKLWKTLENFGKEDCSSSSTWGSNDPSHRGHLRPSEKPDVYTILHDRSRITVRK